MLHARVLATYTTWCEPMPFLQPLDRTSAFPLGA